MPEVLVTSLYKGYIRRNLGTYWKKTANFNKFFVFKDVEPPLIFGTMIKITAWVYHKKLGVRR
jgi:hypothetical protein